MGLLVSMIQGAAPLFKNALRNRTKTSNSRSIGIPADLVNLDDKPLSVKERDVAAALQKVLSSKQLVGEESVLGLMAKGESYKGRMIRGFVVAMSIDKKNPTPLFIKYIMDLDEPITDTHAYTKALSEAFGDSMDDVKDAMQGAVGDVIVNMDDKDFENIITNLI